MPPVWSIDQQSEMRVMEYRYCRSEEGWSDWTPLPETLGFGSFCSGDTVSLQFRSVPMREPHFKFQVVR